MSDKKNMCNYDHKAHGDGFGHPPPELHCNNNAHILSSPKPVFECSTFRTKKDLLHLRHETFVSHQLLNGGEKQFIYKLCPKYLCITRPICPQFKNKHLYIAINAKVLISRACGAFQFAPPPPPFPLPPPPT